MLGRLTDPTVAHRRRWLTLLVLCLSLMVIGIDNTILNVAIPTLAKPTSAGGLGASASELQWIVDAYTIVFAGLLLTSGSLGDRFGRYRALTIGLVIFGVGSALSAFAPSATVLIGTRALMGIGASAIMPATLSILTNVFHDPRERAKAIGVWAGVSAIGIAIGPIAGGVLLQHFWWGSVFLITLPLAAIALVMAVIFVPSHVNETTDRVDNLGGILSLVLVGSLILSINFAPVPNKGTLTLVLAAIAAVALVGFYVRQRHAQSPLYDLEVASRRTFWVAACAGIVVFGSLMGAAFVSQQYLQNVLGYSSSEAGAAILPAVVFMILVAPRSAKLVESRGARFTLLCGYVALFLAFLTMLLLWRENSPYWHIALAYVFIGIGVGLAGTPASHSLTGSVPVKRAGMASGTADLQRDLGGAIMQSIFGALLTAGYATAATAAVASSNAHVTSGVENQLTKSFDGAESIAKQYPRHSSEIIAGAKGAFLHGDHWAYAAGLIAVVLGGALVFFCFPAKEEEQAMLARFAVEDSGAPPVDSARPDAPPQPSPAA
jgi:MFS transporter, DHA2 family, multidrug resistance protein